MVKSRKPPSGRTNLASCIVATIFLIFIIIIIFIIYFTIFKPKSPVITVNSIQLPSFSTSNGTVSFTFSIYVSIANPNHDVFSHYDSSLQLLYSGKRVGFMFVPAGKINSGRTQYMAATFSVKAFPLMVNGPESVGGPIVSDGLSGFRVGSNMEVESRLEMVGRVRVLHFFNHHVETKAECRIDISVSDGSVTAFHC
ncbi:hypothetical protein CQW23_00220 [Capsicum baccatum]|uniref:Uncharacterized protein n=1 Tax=Capsicum baccatum TaxID=33114 RepID=A0A2G2XK63_CAPBA|nr:uncharacterized protein LOC107855306 [Capsicum annuum]KAF3630280.1 putative GDSL esterase/lipase-like [Capsicum annuum]PHT57857.1 hypothetical protein CQW23_00220 [Capsicum baccatum]